MSVAMTLTKQYSEQSGQDDAMAMVQPCVQPNPLPDACRSGTQKALTPTPSRDT